VDKLNKSCNTFKPLHDLQQSLFEQLPTGALQLQQKHSKITVH